MASTVFVDGQTPIVASWLNDVNNLVYSGGSLTVNWGGILGTLSNQTDLQNALNAKAPSTSGTSILYGNGSGGFSSVVIGSGLSFTGGTLSASGGSMVYPSAGIPNSTGSAWGTSYTTTGSGTVLVLATSPTITTPTLSGTVSWGTGSITAPAGSTSTFLRNDGTWATPSGGGNVSNTGTPTSGQAAEWTSATVIQGVAVTGTGSYVKATSPTLVTPVLGTPTSGTLTNCTSIPVANATGALPVANGGTGATATTGSGSNVLATSPTLVTPVLGTPTSGNLSNCTADGTNAVGFKNIPQNSQSAAYTTVLADAGKHIYHPSADTTARTFTIDSNANVAYPIGTAITFVNDTSAGVVTIAITADTLVLAGAGTTGSRTLAANGVATAIKVTSTRWIISGTGLT